MSGGAGRRWSLTAAATGVLVLLAGVGWLIVVLVRHGADDADQQASVLAAIVAAAVATIGLLEWARRCRLQASIPPNAEQVDQAAATLAAVHQYGAGRARELGGRVVSAHVHSSVRMVGREEELADLRAAFTTARVSGRPVLRVLTGLGGVGKTSLARNYAQRHLDDYGVVWWVRAEDPAAIPNEFRTLLEILAPAGRRCGGRPGSGGTQPASRTA